MSFTHALKWSFLSELAAKAIQPVVFIVLARLLTPEDFGVMTAAMMVIAFSQIFWEAGMGKALIQRQTHIEEAANAAFMINIGLGVLIASLLYLFAQPIAQTFFQDERVTAVLQVMTLQVLLGALGSVQTALLQKEMGFKKLFWVRFATVSLPGVVSIPLALNGLGYWALVAGTLVGQLAQVLMLWWMSHWRPGGTRDSLVTKEIAKFGGWVGLSGLLGWFYMWVDSLIVGMYLGGHELGLYRLGSQLSTVIFGMAFAPMLPVLYSHLSKINNDKSRVAAVANRAISTIALLSLPVGLYLYFASPGIENILFDEKWIGIYLVIGFMSLSQAVSYLAAPNQEVYRAVGKPHFETIAMIMALPIYLTVYVLSIKGGFQEFLVSRFLLTVFTIVFHFAVLRLVIKYDIKIIVKSISIPLVISLAVLAPSAHLAELPEVSLAQQSILLSVVFILILAPLLFLYGKKMNLIKIQLKKG